MVKILILLTLIPIIEAVIDFYIIRDAKTYGKEWHLWKFPYLAMWSVVIYLGFSWLMVLYYAVARNLFFNSFLNRLRKKKIYYRSSKNSDSIFKNYEKIVFVLGIIGYITTLIYIIKWQH
jgi:hypothetical protein